MGASAIGLSHVAVQFPVYEYFKKSLGERRQKERGEASVADRLSTVDLILASSSSKVIGHRPSQLPAYQLALCASVATVTPAHLSLLLPFPLVSAAALLLSSAACWLACSIGCGSVWQNVLAAGDSWVAAALRAKPCIFWLCTGHFLQ